MSFAACAGTAITARPIPAPRSVGNRRVRMALLLPAVSANGAGFTRVSRDAIPRAIPASKGAPPACEPIGAKGENWACVIPPTRVTMLSSQLSMESIPIPIKSSIQVSQTTFIGMKPMRRKLMLTLTASAAALLLALANQPVWAQDEPALTGTVSSDAEGNREGVVATAAQPGSIVRVSVTTDGQGRYAFPQNRLLPGEYTISIRAVGYEIDGLTKAMVEAEKTTTSDIKLKKTKNLAGQLTNAEWMMSIP